MRRQPPRSTRTDTLFPYTTLFRSPLCALCLGSRIREFSTVPGAPPSRSEEHTSELQSLIRISYAVFCLKKKIKSHKQKEHSIQYNRKDKQKQKVDASDEQTMK